MTVHGDVTSVLLQFTSVVLVLSLQSLFHLPVFRRLVLNYHLSEQVLEKCKSHSVSPTDRTQAVMFLSSRAARSGFTMGLCQQDKRNIAFMQELRCLFALMVGSTRRFVDPSAAVELLRDAFRTSEAQQVPP